MHTSQNEIHITFSALTKLKLELFVDSPIFLLNYILDCGDISNIPYSNKNLYTESDKDMNSIKQKIDENLTIIDSYPSNTNVYIWIRTSITNELCNLAYFSKRLEKYNNVFLIQLYQGTQIQNYPYIKHSTKSQTNDLIKFNLMWQKIVNENSTIRLSHNYDILNVNINSLNNYLIPCLSENYEPSSDIVNKFISNIKDKLCVNLSLLQAYKILRNLVNCNIIISEQKIDFPLTNKLLKNVKFKLNSQ